MSKIIGDRKCEMQNPKGRKSSERSESKQVSAKTVEVGTLYTIERDAKVRSPDALTTI